MVFIIITNIIDVHNVLNNVKLVMTKDNVLSVLMKLFLIILNVYSDVPLEPFNQELLLLKHVKIVVLLVKVVLNQLTVVLCVVNPFMFNILEMQHLLMLLHV